MCYEFLLSTDAPLDLATLNSETAFFEPSSDERYIHNVKHKYKYRIATGAPNCCSCHFRIVDYDYKDESLEYLQQWYFDEQPDDIEVINTQWLLDIIKNLVNQGYQVDTYVAQGYMEYDPTLEQQVININDANMDNFTFIECIYYSYQP